MGPHRRVHCGGSAERYLCKEALCLGSSAKTDFSRPQNSMRIGVNFELYGWRIRGSSKKGGERRFGEIEDVRML